ncbi:DHH family phosphoesterase [Chloroflexi bacterium TSY]|nr:DHH family phosphoesterase [Chloroflexi bacterium TSY]
MEFEVILTHEYADFDAVASLVAASLLFPNTFPIRSRWINRNAKAFISEHPKKIQLYHPKQLPRGHVSRVILVDTSSVSSVRGMDKETDYLVIDHHKREKPLPDHWQVWTDPVGANVTLLAEKLRGENRSIDPVHATLMAMAIHEDTGSLTYASTTPRDAHCLAWFLEQGADMADIARYIHHPLSSAQSTLLDLLERQSEFIEISNRTILIASGHVLEFRDEFSSIAKSLRNKYEVDALFLLIARDDVIQLVARSTTDDIDVGTIARQLGGGGHSRAAAAPVQEQTNDEVRTKIIELVRRQLGSVDI